MKHVYDYMIVGGGLAGASAVEGIRELDEVGSILLSGKESHLPYDRPPLSKQLWFGKQQVEDIFVHDARSTIHMPLPWHWEQQRLNSIPARKP